MFKNVAGIILAGGKSKRMRQDKALIKIGDLTAIEIVYEKLKSIFENVFIIANDPSKYSFLEIKVYEDIFKDVGPLAGIHSGLRHSSNENNFFISCDMVLMRKEIIEYIVNYPTNKIIKVPRVNEVLQPLCAVYSRNCMSIIEQLIRESIKSKQPQLNSPYKLIEKQDTEIIEVGNLLSNFPDAFLSMNSDLDYQRVLQILRTHQNT